MVIGRRPCGGGHNFSTLNNFKDIISSPTPTLVDFYADWCGPCKMQTPILEELSRRAKGKVKVIKVDVDRNRDASIRYGVRTIPTLMLFQRGEVVWRHIGVAPLDELEQVVNYHDKIRGSAA